MNRRAFLAAAGAAFTLPLEQIRLAAPFAEVEFGSAAGTLIVMVNSLGEQHTFEFSIVELMASRISFPGLCPELSNQLMCIMHSAIDKLWEEDLRAALFGDGDPKMAIMGLV